MYVDALSSTGSIYTPAHTLHALNIDISCVQETHNDRIYTQPIGDYIIGYGGCNTQPNKQKQKQMEKQIPILLRRAGFTRLVTFRSEFGAKARLLTVWLGFLRIFQFININLVFPKKYGLRAKYGVSQRSLQTQEISEKKSRPGW